MSEEKDNQKDKASEGDTGQGSAGIQGQYAGNDKPDLNKKDRTAPDRKDPDTMNQNGSSQLAMGSRHTEEKDGLTHDSHKKEKKGHEKTDDHQNIHETNDSQ